MQSGTSKSGDGFFKTFIGDFTLSPIVESLPAALNVITARIRAWTGPSQARPSVGGRTQLHHSSPGVTFGVASVCLDNSGKPLPFPPFPIQAPTISPRPLHAVLAATAHFTQLLSMGHAPLKRISLGETLQSSISSPIFNSSTHQHCPVQSGLRSNRGRDLHRRPADGLLRRAPVPVCPQGELVDLSHSQQLKVQS